MRLHDDRGQRLYLSAAERAAFLAAAATAPREVRTFCAVLHSTGARLSEALALSPRRIDLADKVIVMETLKKRRSGIHRAVPAPDALLDLLDMVHGIREAQKRPRLLDAPLWPWSRATAWRRVKEVMASAGLPGGAHATPKGLRHGYGVAAVGAGVPLNLLRKWMGHASIETTAIYANAIGAEERAIAARMWQ